MVEISRTRAIVESDEKYRGKIVPTERAEINRPVIIEANGTVTGGAYGEEVTVESNAYIAGPVMAKEAVEISGGEIGGGVGTPGKVTGEGGQIQSSVTGNRITLKNCIVRGNIIGREVHLEDSVVIGVVVAERNLRLRNTTCYTFKSLGDTRVDNAKIVLPQALVDGPLSLESPIEVTGLEKGDAALEEGARPELTEKDRMESDGKQYLTLANRVLNLQKVRDRISDLEESLWSTVTGEDDGNALAEAGVGFDDLPDMTEIEEENVEDVVESEALGGETDEGSENGGVETQEDDVVEEETAQSGEEQDKGNSGTVEDSEGYFDDPFDDSG